MNSDDARLNGATHFKILDALRLVSRHRFALGTFLLPLLIRTIPEILVGPYPVGWDIIAYYIPSSLNIASGNVSFWGALTSSLLYAVVVPAYLLTKTNLVMIFKILGPILYGLLGWSIFRFCRTRLNWTDRKAFFAVLFISSYFVMLRLAWDAYEAEVGLALLLLAESTVGSGKSMRSSIARVSLLLLAVLANQLVGVLVVGTQLANLLRTSSWARPKLASLELVPVALFGLVVYATLQSQLGPGLAVVGSGASLLSLFDSTAFLVYAFVFVVPLLLFGLKLPARSVFTSWVVVCILGLLLAVIPAHVFQDIGYRWVLLLTVPVLIITYEGFSKLSATLAITRRSWSTYLRAAVVVGLAGSATLFAVLPAQSPFPFYTVFPQYFPSSMVQSSLPASDYANAVSAMTWLNAHTGSDSALIMQQAFYGWARMYLSSERMILNCYLDSPSSMLSQVGSFTHVYTVWWGQGSGWFRNSFPDGARPVVSFGGLVVYQYR